MYPFMTLDDDTEIVHSQMMDDGTVIVRIETPDEKDCFHNICCILPQYEWKDNNGYTDEEVEKFKEIIESTAHLIMRFAKDGGFENASSF